MSAQLKPFYMWAGGKTKVVKSYSPIWPNMDEFNNYVEPFFGGGAIYCWLQNNVKHEMTYTIGDINSELAQMLISVRDNTDSFIATSERLAKQCLKLETKEERKKWYYRQRQLYWKAPTSARLYVLMRTGFNGIWQSCKQSEGLFATPAGLLNQQQLQQIVDAGLIKSWANALRETHIHAGPYGTIRLPNKGRTLVYLDPPYRDSFTTYATGFSDKDQELLIKWFRKQAYDGHKILMSNRCVKGDRFFETRLEDIADIHYIQVIYTAGRRKVTANGFEAKPARELLIVSRDI